jgi:ClpP class serine protease
MSVYQDLLNNVKDGKQLFETRLQLMQQIERLTGRKLIVYAADEKKPPPFNSIESEDIMGFSDLIRGLEGSALDILLNSPGGSAEATAHIVNFLRANFSDIRFIVPYMAMSAATPDVLSRQRDRYG